MFLNCANKVENEAHIRTLITHRSLGLAHLEESNLNEAAAEFQSLIDLAPDEALGYANLGLTRLRMGEFEQAEEDVNRALNLDRYNPEIRAILALIYEMSNREKEAIQILQGTLKRHPDHVMTLYNLVQFYTKSRDPASLQTAEKHLNKIVEIHPGNIAARLQLVEVLVQNEKPDQAIAQLEQIRQILPQLPEGSGEVLNRSLDLIRDGSTQEAFPSARIFHNLLKSTDFYQAAIMQLKGPGGPLTGTPLVHFSNDYKFTTENRAQLLDAVTFRDVSLNAGLAEISNQPGNSPAIENTSFAIGDYDNDGDIDLYLAQWSSEPPENRIFLLENNNGVFENRTGDSGLRHPGQDRDAIFGDYDNDGFLDLYVVNSGANLLYHNNGNGSFRNVSIPAGVRDTSNGNKALFGDFDLDGDLDIFVANPGANALYRNNLDGTFTELAHKMGVAGADEVSKDVAFGDYDEDGDLDLTVANANSPLQLYTNLRQSFFEDITGRSGLGESVAGAGAVATGDYNNDGFPDILFVSESGDAHSLYRNDQTGEFRPEKSAGELLSSIQGLSGHDCAFLDFNNDGWLDILFAGEKTLLFANNGNGEFTPVDAFSGEDLQSTSRIEVADYDNDGDVDLFLVDGNGNLRLFRNDGGNVNRYLKVQLTGLRTGSGKNNYFGIGAKVEVKAGKLYQMKVMKDPVAHFGLGDREKADVVRVVWSNGVPQNRFQPESNQLIVEKQILKGSCPWLYAWNGEEFQFVTDVLWPSALGMPVGIMGEGTNYAYSFPNSTDEHLRIPGESLKPKDGRYILQYTDELWETPYVDKINLVAVDHPDSVEVYINERFTLPPFDPPQVYSVAEKQTPVAARDGQGRDVLSKINSIDGQYITDMKPSDFQGIMNPHDVILDLGEIPKDAPLHLFMYGWVFPTDASINVSMAQSEDHKSMAPSLAVPDSRGNWVTVIPNLGFPKGKNKMVITDLTGKFLTDDHRVRIRTNMQIYWDRIFYTTGTVSTPVEKTNLRPAAADLHYRGFSKVTRETPYSPHLPDYGEVDTGQRWRDLVGYYTRYGDVLSLLEESDSKYVIMNAGDEITIEFDASDLPPLRDGWTRDFLFYNDGWLKDGDLNTAEGQRVKPLPFQGMSSYPYGDNDKYPDDEDHREFLEKYNTREVTGREFRNVLKNYTDN